VKTAHFLFLFVFVSLSRVLCFVSDFSCIMTLSGKLLLFAMVFIVFHSVFVFLLLAVGIAFSCCTVGMLRFVFVGVVGIIVDCCVRCGGFSVYVYFQLGIVPDYCEI